MKYKCYHKNIEELKEFRKNYPFGRKSEPRFSFKKVYAVKCLNCGQVNKRGVWK